MFDGATWFFITSGLFLGWSLGANNAVTLFGTAVTSRMVRFRVAALVAGVFTVAGAVLSGGGTTQTLTALGGIDAIAGSFTVALSVALSVTWMTRARLPVSTSQAVVGAIVGWNVFTGSPTDFGSLSRIFGTWMVSPLIAGVFGFLIFKVIKRTVSALRIHMLSLDHYTRIGLIVVGALASYSLGANNIANVMGLFVAATPVGDVLVAGPLHLSGAHILFFLGGLAIATGIFTYGRQVMNTVGSDLFRVSPLTGLAVVLSELVVLFLFTSQTLERLLLELGLPAIPLVPLAATQAFVGAVIGVGLAKDPQSVDFRVFGKISIGWITAPLASGVMSFILLYVMQNVFEQRVIDSTPYQLTRTMIARLEREGVDARALDTLVDRRFPNAKSFRSAITQRGRYTNNQLYTIYQFAMIDSFRIDVFKLRQIDTLRYDRRVLEIIRRNHGRVFSHRMDFEDVVFGNRREWEATGDRLVDMDTHERKIQLEDVMRVRARRER